MESSYDIALDISFLSAAGGFGSYTTHLLRNLARLDSGRRYLLLENELPATVPQYANREANRKARLPEIPAHWNIETTRRHSRVAWMLFDLPRQIRRFRPKIFHSVDNVTVPSSSASCRTILTLHDIIPLTHPQYCRFRDALAARWMIGRAVRRADFLLTDSHYSAEQIVDYFPCAENKIHTIYLGVDHTVFTPLPNRQETAQEIARARLLYSPVYFLCVVTLNPRRNLVRLLQAYHRYLPTSRDRDTCLVVAGCRGWKDHDIFEAVRNLDLEKRVHFLDFVPDNELTLLYQTARALIHPSLLEGFGLPVLEAMACETPVVCSSTSSLGEIAGEAALLVDPLGIDSIAQAVNAVHRDDALRKELTRKGIERARRFNWEETARQVAAVYDSLLEGDKR